MSLLRLAIAARERFVSAGIPPDQAAIDAEVLARRAAGWDRATWLAHRDEEGAPDVMARFEAWVVRREHREPVAYIIGVREFWGLEFLVTPAVLIPRPETELIVETALNVLATDRHQAIADVGTGSGCLAVSLAHERPRATVVATDISPEALQVARANARRHGVDGRITFAETSLLDHLPGPFDLIVANPPYVPSASRPTLSPDVKDHEPDTALFGHDEDGLAEARTLIAQAGSRLAPGGMLLMEFGFGQGDAIRDAMQMTQDLQLDRILRDLQGHERTLLARRGGSA